MFNEPMTVYVVVNTIPEKRTGKYLLIFNRMSEVLAYGLSHADAVRAQQDGAAYLGRADAENLLAEVK